MTRSEEPGAPDDEAKGGAGAEPDGPRECCFNDAGRTLLAEYGPGRARWRCDGCKREFFYTRMYFDDSCIETMDYELWRSAAPGDDPAGAELSDYIMNHKPYYARNAAAAGDFQRVD